jgi:hypothetical protein
VGVNGSSDSMQKSSRVTNIYIIKAIVKISLGEFPPICIFVGNESCLTSLALLLLENVL